jgi:hypothetical protein
MTVTTVVCRSVATESVEVSGASRHICSFVRTFDLDIYVSKFGTSLQNRLCDVRK